VLFHKVFFMHNSGLQRSRFKVMWWSRGLPAHNSMELTLGTGREPDLSHGM